jgi:hypothetical protein
MPTDEAGRTGGTGGTSTTPLLDPAPSLDGTGSLDAGPSLTVDPIRAVQMRQPSEQFDFGTPPAAAAATSKGPGRRVPLWAAIAAAVVVACGGAVAVKAFAGSSPKSSSSLSVDTNALPAASASGTSPAAGAARQGKPGPHDTTGPRGTQNPASPAAGGTNAATSGSKPATQRSAGASAPSAPASAPAAGSSPSSSAPASKPNPYTATEVCGSGYSVVDSHSLSGGTVYLLWSNSAGKNCVATMRSRAAGKIAMLATLKVEGGSTSSDSGSYTYYAGPVALKAAATCVEWGGSIGSSSWTSGWSHCS